MIFPRPDQFRSPLVSPPLSRSTIRLAAVLTREPMKETDYAGSIDRLPSAETPGSASPGSWILSLAVTISWRSGPICRSPIGSLRGSRRVTADRTTIVWRADGATSSRSCWVEPFDRGRLDHVNGRRPTILRFQSQQRLNELPSITDVAQVEEVSNQRIHIRDRSTSGALCCRPSQLKRSDATLTPKVWSIPRRPPGTRQECSEHPVAER